MLIDYIDIMYLLEKLFNALYVFFLGIEETELYSTSRNRLAFSNLFGAAEWVSFFRLVDSLIIRLTS